jgi:uncharacterized protein (DUF1684 family)
VQIRVISWIEITYRCRPAALLLVLPTLHLARFAYTFPMRRYHVFAIVLLSCLLSTLVPISGRSRDESWQRELSDWRLKHDSELQKPDGWLALVGLEWLRPGDNSFGSAPDNRVHLPSPAPPHVGVLHLDGPTVTIGPAPSVSGGFPGGFLIDGQPAAAQTLHTDPDNDKNNPRLAIGSLTMYVIQRGGRYGLRIKDSNSEALRRFHGLNWFPLNPKYRVMARWIPYDPPRSTTLTTLIGTHYSQPVPGAAEFTLAGKSYRLEPVIEDPAEAKLFFIMRDQTSKSTTYGACRFLYTSYPDKGLTIPGTLVLDFNQLENPPCAYTPYATCPLPPPGNRLAIRLPVGEKCYHD